MNRTQEEIDIDIQSLMALEIALCDNVKCIASGICAGEACGECAP